MNRIIQSFTDKKFKYGAFSALTILLVAAALIVVNLIFGRLNLSADLTPEKRYSLSDASKEIVRALQEDVRIYALFRENSTDTMLTDIADELLRQYQKESPHIQIEYRDPELYPQFVADKAGGQQVATGSLIVESDKRLKILQPSDLYTTTFNYQTYEESVSSVEVEPQISNAIRYVSVTNSAVIYTVTGHDEIPLPEELARQLNMANFDIKPLDLLMENVPEDCSLLFVTQPARDWGGEEAEKVKGYLAGDGRGIFFMDYTNTAMPNLYGVLEAYGVQMSGMVVLEGSAGHYFNNNPSYVLPAYSKDHTVTNPLTEKGYRVFTPSPQAVQEMEMKKNSLKFEPLLVTSNQAYGKSFDSISSYNRDQGDPLGPFTLAAAITDSYYTSDNHLTKLVVTGAALLLDAGPNSLVSGANYAFLLNCVNWTQDAEQSTYIRPLSATESYIQITQGQFILFFVLFVVLLPLGIFAAGFVVWLRRRHS